MWSKVVIRNFMKRKWEGCSYCVNQGISSNNVLEVMIPNYFLCSGFPLDVVTFIWSNIEWNFCKNNSFPLQRSVQAIKAALHNPDNSTLHALRVKEAIYTRGIVLEDLCSSTNLNFTPKYPVDARHQPYNGARAQLEWQSYMNFHSIRFVHKSPTL